MNNLANVLQEQGLPDEAISIARRALQLRPNWPEIHNTLGNLLKEQGNYPQSECYKKALLLRPDFPDAMNNLANVLQESGSLDEAIALFQKAIAIQPNLPQAHYNLGNALQVAGRVDEAIASFDRSLAIQPENAITHSNRIYALHFHPAYDTPAICNELAKWNRLHAMPLAASIVPYRNTPDPGRRLKIGYVSSDFCEHVVGWNLFPLMTNHDHQRFEIYCYSSAGTPDLMTEKLKANSDVWRDVARAPDEQVAQLVRSDQIDILIDLSLHSAHHRLLLFARKPAPIQMTYLGYCSSTGLTAIDYRLSDPFMDSIEMEAYYSEKTVRMPRAYWCYQPGIEAPEVNVLPALTHGHITFGCLNNFAKIQQPVVMIWAKILAAIPGARLMLHAPLGSPRQRILDWFTQTGIAAERVVFVQKQRLPEYFQTYQTMDIALDPFPYGGGITSCDGLWMGVPPVTLVGSTAVGRGGKSILENLGLGDLTAETPEQYVQAAVNLASDLNKLANLRACLRDKMRASALMDAPGFARDIEQIYRQIWRDWCGKQVGT